MYLDSVPIHFSFIGYYALIPVFLFFIVYCVIEVMEKGLHRYVLHKNKIYLYVGGFCFIIAIALIIAAFFV